MSQSLIDWTEEELEEGRDCDLAPLPVPTRCQPGDVWSLGRHTLYCADSENLDHVHRTVNNHGYATLVFTDPPYQMDTLHRSRTSFLGMGDGGQNMRPVHQAITDMGIGTFDPQCFLSLLPNYFRPGTIAAYIFHSKDSAPDYLGWVRDQKQTIAKILGTGSESCLSLLTNPLRGMVCTPLVWYKVNADGRANPIPFGKAHHTDVEYVVHIHKDDEGHIVDMELEDLSDTESILYVRLKGKWNNRDKAPFAHRGRVLCHPKVKGEHPTIKPVALIVNQLLLTSDVDDRVYDPYGGSGSTLIACEETGRRCVMTEQLPRYCDLTISRWEGASGKRAEKIEVHKD